jgi:hypothetical protein
MAVSDHSREYLPNTAGTDICNIKDLQEGLRKNFASHHRASASRPILRETAISS